MYVVLGIINDLEMIQNMCVWWLFAKTALFHKRGLGVCREPWSQSSVGTEGWLYCVFIKMKMWLAYAQCIVCITVSPMSSVQDNEPQETKAAEEQRRRTQEMSVGLRASHPSFPHIIIVYFFPERLSFHSCFFILVRQWQSVLNKVMNTEYSVGPTLCSALGEVVAVTHFILSTFFMYSIFSQVIL